MSQIELVPHSSIHPSPLNPRKRIEPEALAELAESIRAEGLLQNLVVRKAYEDLKDLDGHYEIAAGERRWRAIAQLVEAGHLPADHPVPVTVRDLSDLQLLQLATTENLARADMTPLEEAHAFLAMLDLGSDVETIAAETGFSLATVRRRLELVTRLHPRLVKALEEGEINLGQAQAFTTASIEAQGRWIGDRSVVEVDGETLRKDTEAVKLSHGVVASSPHQIKMFMREQVAIPVSRARFALSRYEGTYTQAGIFDETGEDLFDDVDQFHRLQREWVEETATRLRQTWNWVGVDLSSPHKPWQLTQESDEKVSADQLGVHIGYNPRSGEVRLYERLLKPGKVPRGGTGDRAPVDVQRLSGPQAFTVARLRTHALQRAVLDSDDFRVHLALLITALTSFYSLELLPIRGQDGTHNTAAEPIEELERLAAGAHPALAAKHGGWRSEYDATDVLPHLLTQSLEDLLEILRALVAQQVRVSEGRISPIQAFLMDHLDVQLPTIRDLGAEWLSMNSKARMQQVVAPALLPEDVAAEASGLTRKALVARVLATGGERLDQVPRELATPDWRELAAAGRLRGSENDQDDGASDDELYDDVEDEDAA